MDDKESTEKTMKEPTLCRKEAGGDKPQQEHRNGTKIGSKEG